MMRTGVIALSLAASAVCFGQHNPYGSIGGFGNVIYPGTGHAPNVNPSPVPYAARGGQPGYGAFRAAPRVNHPQHSRTVVVPYPVVVGGYYYGYPGTGYVDPYQQPADAAPPADSLNAPPSVVINQGFVPDRPVPVVQDYSYDSADPNAGSPGMRLYEGPKTPVYVPPNARRSAADDQPTLILIAFKDHTIISALGYWVEGSSLHYVSAERTLNQVSLDLVDRDLSQRLNDERNVEFKLPKGE
jgi:hypothetical protein